MNKTLKAYMYGYYRFYVMIYHPNGVTTAKYMTYNGAYKLVTALKEDKDSPPFSFLGSHILYGVLGFYEKLGPYNIR